MALLRRGAVVCGAVLLLALLPAARGTGHVGNRLRLGYRPEPTLEILARLTELYIEEVSGYTVDLKRLPDSEALKEAIVNEEVDLAVEYPAEAWARACPSRGVLLENVFAQTKDYYRENYGAVWIGTFNIRREGLLCYAPSYVISRGVAEDLAYYTLPDYLRKLVSHVTQGEVDDLLSRIPPEGGRKILEDYLARIGLI